MPFELKKTFLDRRIESVFPGWAAKRYEARASIEQRYGASRRSKDRPLSDRPIESEEGFDHQEDCIQLMRESRDLFDDFAPISGAVKTIGINCTPVGWCSCYPSNDLEVIRKLTDYVNGRIEAHRFDLSGRHDAFQMFNLSLRDMIVDGDNGWHFFRPGSKPTDPSFVQSVRGHRLGNIHTLDPYAFDVPGRPGKFLHVRGLNIERSTGRVVSYEVWKDNDAKTPGGEMVFDRAIAAPNFFHAFDPEHLDTYRGVPPFHSCIMEIKDLKVIWEYQRKQMELAASIQGVVTTKDGTVGRLDSHISFEEITPEGADEAEKQYRKAYYNVKRGHLRYLDAEEDMKQFIQENPNAQFWDFVKWLMSTAAWSLALPYSFLYAAEGTSGAPLRLEVSRAAKTFHFFRRNLLMRTLNPWLHRIIAEGLVSGELNLNPGEYRNYIKGKWQFGRDVTADEGRIGGMHLKEGRAGVRSRGSISEQLGEGSFFDVVTTREGEGDLIIAAATRLFDKHEGRVSMQVCVDLVAAGFDNPTKVEAPPGPGEEDDDEPNKKKEDSESSAVAA